MNSLIEQAREARNNRWMERMSHQLAQAEKERVDVAGCYRLVHRGYVRVVGEDYWAKELESLDGQQVFITGIKADGSRHVFLNDDFICSISQTVPSEGRGFLKIPF